MTHKVRWTYEIGANDSILLYMAQSHDGGISYSLPVYQYHLADGSTPSYANSICERFNRKQISD